VATMDDSHSNTGAPAAGGPEPEAEPRSPEGTPPADTPDGEADAEPRSLDDLAPVGGSRC